MKFEKVSRLAAADFKLPVRKTKNSAGYDFEVAEDIVIPTFARNWDTLIKSTPIPLEETFTLNEVASLTKSTKAKPTLVSTGVKCQLDEGYYLELSVRSSTPLKYWLVLANSVGIIDADYYNNQDNEGEIFFQVINFSPFPIQLKRGDIIGQGIIKKYHKIENDDANAERIGGLGSTTNTMPNACGLRSQANVVDDYCGRGIEDAVSRALKEELAKGMFSL